MIAIIRIFIAQLLFNIGAFHLGLLIDPEVKCSGDGQVDAYLIEKNGNPCRWPVDKNVSDAELEKELEYVNGYFDDRPYERIVRTVREI